MDFQDNLTPLYKPTPPPPKQPPRIPVALIVVVGVLIIAGLSWLASSKITSGALESNQARQQKVAEVSKLPDAGVLIGEPFIWRELATFTEKVDLENPRPSAAFGDFTGDGRDDILLIDLAGPTRIIQADGTSTEVKGADWKSLARYKTWDYDNDGIDDLIPGSSLYIYRPHVKDYVTVRSKGG